MGTRFTLHPVPYETTEADWWAAWRLDNRVSRKTWLILGAITVFGLIGMGVLIWLKTNPFLFILVLAGVILYLGFRLYLMEWLTRRQLKQQNPEWRVDGLKIGLQPNGLSFVQTVALPPQAGKQRKSGKRKGNKTALRQPQATQAALVPWDQFEGWCENDQVLVLYRKAGGFQVLPKRLNSPEFQIDSVRDMLRLHLGAAR